MMRILKSYGILPNLLRIIEQMYINTKAVVISTRRRNGDVCHLAEMRGLSATAKQVSGSKWNNREWIVLDYHIV